MLIPYPGMNRKRSHGNKAKGALHLLAVSDIASTASLLISLYLRRPLWNLQLFTDVLPLWMSHKVN